MDYSFDINNAEILNFSPHKGRDYAKPKFIFWPAYAYRILAPVETKQKLNGFQKAVLGFCRSNISDPKSIGEYLHLDPQLIIFIQKELKDKSYIDHDFKITPIGADFLLSEFDKVSPKITVAYVFQDPFQDRLWPRVVSEKKLANVDFIGEEGFPRLIMAPTGIPSGHDPRPFVFQPRELQNLPRIPEISEVIEAVKRHQREETFYLKQDRELEHDDEDMPDEMVDRSEFASVEIISYEPQPCFLTSFLYVPKHPVEKDEWYVCDPFGRGESRMFRKWIEIQFEKHPKLHEEVEYLLKSQGTQTNDIEAHFMRFEEQAARSINDELGEEVKSLPFYDWLLAMERVHQELKELNSPPVDQIEACLINGTKTLETVLSYIQTQFPPGTAWKIYDNRETGFRADLLEQIIEKLNFKKPRNIANLAHIQPANIRRVAEKGGGTLNERLIVALLTARLEPAHPFFIAASTMPDFLIDFQEISQIRGSSAHASEGRLDYPKLEKLIEKLYQIIRAIVPIKK